MPNSSLWPFMRVADDHARQGHDRRDRKVDAAPDDDDGLGDGCQDQRQHRDREALDPGRPVAGLDALGEQQQDDQEGQEAERPVNGGVPSRRSPRGVPGRPQSCPPPSSSAFR